MDDELQARRDARRLDTNSPIGEPVESGMQRRWSQSPEYREARRRLLEKGQHVKLYLEVLERELHEGEKQQLDDLAAVITEHGGKVERLPPAEDGKNALLGFMTYMPAYHPDLVFTRTENDWVCLEGDEHKIGWALVCFADAGCEYTVWKLED